MRERTIWYKFYFISLPVFIISLTNGLDELKSLVSPRKVVYLQLIKQVKQGSLLFFASVKLTFP